MNQWDKMLLKTRFFQFSFFLILSSFFSCSVDSPHKSVSLFKLSGESQGTTYLIQVYDENLNFEARQIDSILRAFDHELSTYEPSSLITRFNQKDFKDTILPYDSRFYQMLDLSDYIYTLSNGFFDPSIKPLIDLWGFDNDQTNIPDKQVIDSVLQFVSFERGVHYDFSQFTDTSFRIVKHNPMFQLDFNAIAQGYAVDLLLDFINTKGHQNVYVELGGEIAVSGVKFNKEKWRIGVETPISNNKTSDKVIQKVFSLTDKRIATSGNYRKYFVVDNKKYSHTINPKTGYQNRHNLLSATVFSNSCARSDAFATFFMLIGVEASKSFIQVHPELELDIFLIFDESNQFKTYLSEGLLSSEG